MTWHPPILDLGVLGLVQTWRPDAPGQWPDAEGPREVIPPPCPTCTGELSRRRVILNAGEIGRAEYANAKRAAAGRPHEQEAVPAPVVGWLYDLAHRRTCRPASPPRLAQHRNPARRGRTT